MRTAEELIAAVDAHIVKTEGRSRHAVRIRPSELGDECWLRVWLNFRWTTPPEVFDGGKLRIFRRGRLLEDQLLDDLENAGYDLRRTDPDNPKQQIAVEGLGGHLYGKLDGAGRDGAYRAAPWVVVEAKSHKQELFNKLLREGVRSAHPKHYAQMQCYLGLTHLTKALYVAGCKNTERPYYEFIDFDPDFFRFLMERAQTIKDGRILPERLGGPAFYKCKGCRHHPVCHARAEVEHNCRTCEHVTPIDGGKWHCKLHGEDVPTSRQIIGCPAWQKSALLQELQATGKAAPAIPPSESVAQPSPSAP